MTTATPEQTAPDNDGQIDVGDYVDRLTAEVARLTQRAIQAEALADRYRQERDEARAAVDQVLTAKPGTPRDAE